MSEILFCIPQKSTLGPFFFNILLANLFLIIRDIYIASYTDDSAPFIVQNNTGNFIASLKEASNAFFNNSWKSNPGTCHALFSINKDLGIKIGDCTIGKSECENY